MKIAVVGGTGQMGRITVRDLYESGVEKIVVIGSHKKSVQTFHKQYQKRVIGKVVDAANIRKLTKAIRGLDVVINAAQYQLNLQVMRAALRAGCHYVDLGGLFHMTKKQLKLHKQFQKKNLVAIIGMGASPGITNALALNGARMLDSVNEVHIRIGSWDGTKVIQSSPLASSYSLQTILEEFSYRPAVFTKGRLRFVDPMSGSEKCRLPHPVGVIHPMYTLHSELATLPKNFRGVREVTFKIAFEKEFIEKVKLLHDIGLTSEKPMLVGKERIVPKDFLLSVLGKLPKPKYGKPRQHEIIRVIVKGKLKGKSKTILLDCHATGMPKWGIGLDVDTGSPPSIVAQMIAKGVIRKRGVYPPEKAVEPSALYSELRKRGMRIVIQEK